MKLKETSFTYNLKTKGRGTPDWGAEIGQGAKKLMNIEGVSDIITGMLYYKVDENKVRAVLGKGGTLEPLTSYAPDTSIVLASLIERVIVNDIELFEKKMLLFITKDERDLNEKNKKNIQKNRRTLKFPINSDYNGVNYNKECYEAITEALGCTENGSWIVTDMFFVDDALFLKALVIDKNNPYDFSSSDERSEKLNRIRYMESMNKFKPSDYVGELSPIILYGPPGTGKTNKMQSNYISKFDVENRFVTTFHQSFSYEEFVEGLKPVLTDEEDLGEIKYKVVDGIFKEACERAANMAGYASLKDCIDDDYENRKAQIDKAVNEHKLVLLCIDEINRGNVAAIFGDLISLIETSKRLGSDHEMVATLPYSHKKFAVPRNLLIVGTMNTADRSIQLLDSALRRRFKFEELGPNYDLFIPNSNDADEIKDVKKLASAILKTINARIRCLLNKDNQIGHSYLMYAKSYNDIYDTLMDRIVPLLEEYFYNDVDKIRFVLNDSENSFSFYENDVEATDAYKIYSKESFEDDDKKFYKLKSKKPTDLKEFLKHIIANGVQEVGE